ncbi:MAG: nucleotidyltransferase family protein, partial [Clostridia bacterium]|nr:nucleotidyltransferase family protein [Clostridia bacterium]
ELPYDGVAAVSGADLVLERPFPWCSAGAEFFALGGVGVALGAGADLIVFGSESGDISFVEKVSRIDVSPENVSAETGAGTAAASVYASYGLAPCANDRLGAEYMKASRRLGREVSFDAVRRIGTASASELRRLIYDGGTSAAGEYIPDAAKKVLPPVSDVTCGRLEELEYLYFRLYRKRDDDACFEGTGGVAERLVRAAGEATSSTDFFRCAATKKYTASRLRRAALFDLLGVKKDDLISPPSETLLLAANAVGREYLSKLDGPLSVVTKPSLLQSELCRRADDLYVSCRRDGGRAGDYSRAVPYIK